MITKLTTEQIARFPEFVKRWTDIGLCTQPANRPRAESGIVKLRIGQPVNRPSDQRVKAAVVAERAIEAVRVDRRSPWTKLLTNKRELSHAT